MSAWVVVPSLLSLRAEFNQLSPNRDKGADGTIGDTNHTSSSDHTPDEDSNVLKDHDPDEKNEVHALDIDSSGPWPGTGTQKERFHRINMEVLRREKAKWLSSSDRCRLNYLIWDGRIYDKDNNFIGRDYNGSDPHTNHAHYSNRYEASCENDTRDWGVYTPPAPREWDEMATAAEVKAQVKAGVREVLTEDLAYSGTATTGPRARITAAGWGSTSVAERLDYLVELIMSQDSLYDRLARTDAALAEVQSTLAEIKAALPPAPPA